MYFIDELAEQALSDQYLIKLISKMEKNYGMKVFNSKVSVFIEDKDCNDLLRFADILSRASGYRARNLALKIVGLLQEFEGIKENEYYNLLLTSVLVKLGNFPSMKLIGEGSYNSADIMQEKIIKEVMQKAPGSDFVFTDTQYKVFEKMKKSNHYSFSGPTSFGKSFIFESFMRYIIKERNGVDNIAILVPTRALVNQVSKRLKLEYTGTKYKIISHPKVPILYEREENRYIFIFTAERLISYFSNLDNPPINFLFVDEAHKLLSEKDLRTPLLYHALMQAKRKSVRMYFASPNIPNTEVFLQMFGNSVEECYTVKDSPVYQNRFYIDFIEKKSFMLSNADVDLMLEGLTYYDNEEDNLEELLRKLGGEKQNIIYANTIARTISLALNLTRRLPKSNKSELSELIKYIKETVHDKYYLAECLSCGVAFHFGGMPQEVREKVEELFSAGIIQHLFCTSTLLEGINLPAKNIFILSSKIGTTGMNSIDFWNLAGRAGRLTKELSGNIFCVRLFDTKGYWKTEKELEIFRKREVLSKVPLIMMEKNGNLYKNIDNSLLGESLTRKNMPCDEVKKIEMYSNILIYHEAVKGDSVLRNKYLEKVDKGKENLKKVSDRIIVPEHIISQSVNININIQNEILNQVMELFPSEYEYQDCLKLLTILYDKYHWDEEESKGNKPFIKSKKQLEYYAVLLNSWINAKPLKYIIMTLISHYDNKGNPRIIRVDYHREEEFNKDDSEHINIIIRSAITDIENAIRFKIKGYVNNYSLLLEEKGLEVVDKWEDFLEYGTTDKFMIEIQNVGFSRTLSIILATEYKNYFVVNELNEVLDFDRNLLLKKFDANKYSNEYLELLELLGDEKKI